MRRAAFLVFFLLFPFSASADVVFNDALAVKGEPVMLKAVTRGRFFRKGGEVVRFYVDEKDLGQTLSGGDGAAYKEFRPERTGLYRAKVVSDEGEGEGYVLSLGGGCEVVFIDVKGALYGNIFSTRPREGGVEAVERIMRKFPVLFLMTDIFGTVIVRKWLRQNGFPDAPLLDWKNGRIFTVTEKKGLHIKAVIGSRMVLEEARDIGAELYELSSGEESRREKDWKEIADSLSMGTLNKDRECFEK